MLLSALTLTLLSLFIATPSDKAQAEKILFKDAVHVNLSSDLLSSTIQQVIQQNYAGDRSIFFKDVAIPGLPRFDNASIEGLRLNYKLGKISASIGPTSVIIQGSVRRLSGHINYFFLKPEKFCQNISIASPAGNIPFKVYLKPKITSSGKLRFTIIRHEVNLAGDYLTVGRPQKCRIALGINWFIKQVFPRFVAKFKDKLAQKLDGPLQDFIDDVAYDFERTTPLSFPTPIPKLGSLQDLKASISFTPASVWVQAKNLKARMHLAIELNHPNFPTKRKSKVQLPRLTSIPNGKSRAIVSVSALEAIINELLKAGSLANSTIEGRNTPQLAFLLTSQLVKTIIPESEPYFENREPLTIRLYDMASTTTSLEVIEQESNSPPATSLADLEISGLKVLLETPSAPPYLINLDGTMSAEFSHDESARTLSLGVSGLGDLSPSVYKLNQPDAHLLSEASWEPVPYNAAAVQSYLKLADAVFSSIIKNTATIVFPEIKIMRVKFDVNNIQLSKDTLEIEFGLQQ